MRRIHEILNQYLVPENANFVLLGHLMINTLQEAEM